MPHSAPPNQAPNGSSVLSRLLYEALALLLTVALSGLLLAAIIFAPRSFFTTSYSLAPRGWSGYLTSIGQYLSNLLQGKLSDPAHNAAAWRALLIAARRTLELLGISAALALPIGVGWAALLAGARQPLTRAMLFGLNTVVMALPSFAVLLLAIEAVANTTLHTGYRLTFVQGYGLDRHLILPAGALVLRGAAYLSRALQIAQEDVLRQDWVRAARAKGLGGYTLWRRHVLPALRVPILGILLGMLRVMVGSIVIVDYMYGWGGLGQRMLNLEPLSLTTAETSVSIAAAMALVIVFVVIDSLGQLALRYADPRLRDLQR